MNSYSSGRVALEPTHILTHALPKLHRYFTDEHKYLFDQIVLGVKDLHLVDDIALEFPQNKTVREKLLHLVGLIQSAETAEKGTIAKFLSLLLKQPPLAKIILHSLQESLVESCSETTLSLETTALIRQIREAKKETHALTRKFLGVETFKYFGLLRVLLVAVLIGAVVYVMWLKGFLVFGAVTASQTSSFIHNGTLTEVTNTLPIRNNNDSQLDPVPINQRSFVTANSLPILVNQTSANTAVNLPKNTSGQKRKLVFDIPSFTEYNRLMTNIDINRELSVNISIADPLHDWPDYVVPLKNALEISNLYLDGPFTLNSMFNILSETANIKRLRISNTDDSLCSRVKDTQHLFQALRHLIHLPMLEAIHFENLSACGPFYEAFATLVERLPAVKEVTISRGIIEDTNHFFICKFLTDNCPSLKSLSIYHSKILTSRPIFQPGSNGKYQKVQNLRVDSVTGNSTASLVPIGADFYFLFPRLNIFVNRYGFLSWQNVTNILIIKNLTKLEFGAKIPPGTFTFSIKFLSIAFPKLKAVKLNLYFETCLADNQKNLILDLYTLRFNLKRLSITSNCPVLADLSSVPYEVSENRRIEYANYNGRKSFSFDRV